MEDKKLVIFKYGVLYMLLFCAVFFGLIFFDKDSSKNVQNQVENVQNSEVATTTRDAVKTSQATTTQKTKCPLNNTDFYCYQDFYTNLVKQKGVAEAFTALKKEYETNSYVRSQCHPLSHVVGHAALNIYSDVSTAFEHGDPFCWSGYYHGVMEEVAEKIGLEKLSKNLDSICSGVTGKESYSFDYYNCVHGLGHGLMAVTENELFKSLSLCDNLTGGWEKTSCYGGVFMENVIIDNKGEYTKFLRPTEPLYPCNAVESQYKSSCYLMHTSYMLKVSGQDFQKVFGLCRTVEEGFQDLCFQSLGRDASGQSLSNAEKTKSKCELGENFEEKSNCYIGAVKDFVSYYHSDTQANVLCSMISSDLQKICLDTVSVYYKTF